MHSNLVLKNIAKSCKIEKELFIENVDNLIKGGYVERNYNISHLAKLFLTIDKSLLSQTYILTRTNNNYISSEYQFNPLEFAIRLLRHHIENKSYNSSKNNIFFGQANFTEAQEDILKFVEFLKYLECIAYRSYSYESDNYSLRAIEAGLKCLDWIECFVYYTIDAFAKEIPEKIKEIISLIANDAILARLEFYFKIKPEISYNKSGCVIDNILRNTGNREFIDGTSISRDLFFPFTNISGTTWLNDFKIETILYNAVQSAERSFTKSYTTSFFEREDDLIRDLFDLNLGKEVENAIKIINSNDKKNTKGKWVLKWNKLRLVEEKKVGADIALKVKVDVENCIQFEKIVFIQV